MGLTYFKRYRMEIDLAREIRVRVFLPPGYYLLPWEPRLLAAHAEAKYFSFRTEVDANVFPCLADLDGCLRLMSEISRKEGFLSNATWLAAYDSNRCEKGVADRGATNGKPIFCGTIQGIRDRSGMGAVQNLGIRPEHRGRGLGTSLLLNSLEGFRRVGLRRAFLEVTAQNEGAIKLYRRLGFAKSKTVYKAVEVAYS